jgi:hypothetical protein
MTQPDRAILAALIDDLQILVVEQPDTVRTLAAIVRCLARRPAPAAALKGDAPDGVDSAPV